MTFLDIRNHPAAKAFKPLEGKGSDEIVIRKQGVFRTMSLGEALKFRSLSDKPTKNTTNDYLMPSPRAAHISNTIQNVGNSLRFASSAVLVDEGYKLELNADLEGQLGDARDDLTAKVMAKAAGLLYAGKSDAKSGLKPVTVGGVEQAIQETNKELSNSYADFYNLVHPSPREAPEHKSKGSGKKKVRRAPVDPHGHRWRTPRRRSAEISARTKQKRAIEKKKDAVLNAGRSPDTVAQPASDTGMEMASPFKTPSKNLASARVEAQEPEKVHHQERRLSDDVRNTETPRTFKRKRDDAGVGGKDNE